MLDVDLSRDFHRSVAAPACKGILARPASRARRVTVGANGGSVRQVTRGRRGGAPVRGSGRGGTKEGPFIFGLIDEKGWEIEKR